MKKIIIEKNLYFFRLEGDSFLADANKLSISMLRTYKRKINRFNDVNSK